MGLILDVAVVFIILAFALFYFASTLSEHHSILKWFLSAFALSILLLGIGTEVIVARDLITSQVDSSAQESIKEKVALGYRAMTILFWFMIVYVVIFLIMIPTFLSASELIQRKKNKEREELQKY